MIQSLYTRSAAAFVMSAEKLFAENDRIYFWTFTFVEALPDPWVMPTWNRFLVRLRDIHGGWMRGLRVMELHPGGHGLHIHALLNLRVNVHIVRRVGRKVGIGRVHVKTCNEGAIGYLAKYLAKDVSRIKGARSWGAIGGFRPVTGRHLENDSLYGRNMRELFGGERVAYDTSCMVFRNTALYGHHENWV